MTKVYVEQPRLHRVSVNNWSWSKSNCGRRSRKNVRLGPKAETITFWNLRNSKKYLRQLIPLKSGCFPVTMREVSARFAIKPGEWRLLIWKLEQWGILTGISWVAKFTLLIGKLGLSSLQQVYQPHSSLLSHTSFKCSGKWRDCMWSTKLDVSTNPKQRSPCCFKVYCINLWTGKSF